MMSHTNFIIFFWMTSTLLPRQDAFSLTSASNSLLGKFIKTIPPPAPLHTNGSASFTLPSWLSVMQNTAKRITTQNEPTNVNKKNKRKKKKKKKDMLQQAIEGRRAFNTNVPSVESDFSRIAGYYWRPYVDGFYEPPQLSQQQLQQQQYFKYLPHPHHPHHHNNLYNYNQYNNLDQYRYFDRGLAPSLPANYLPIYEKYIRPTQDNLRNTLDHMMMSGSYNHYHHQSPFHPQLYPPLMTTNAIDDDEFHKTTNRLNNGFYVFSKKSGHNFFIPDHTMSTSDDYHNGDDALLSTTTTNDELPLSLIAIENHELPFSSGGETLTPANSMRTIEIESPNLSKTIDANHMPHTNYHNDNDIHHHHHHDDRKQKEVTFRQKIIEHINSSSNDDGKPFGERTRLLELKSNRNQKQNSNLHQPQSPVFAANDKSGDDEHRYVRYYHQNFAPRSSSIDIFDPKEHHSMDDIFNNFQSLLDSSPQYNANHHDRHQDNKYSNPHQSKSSIDTRHRSPYDEDNNNNSKRNNNSRWSVEKIRKFPIANITTIIKTATAAPASTTTAGSNVKNQNNKDFGAGEKKLEKKNLTQSFAGNHLMKSLSGGDGSGEIKNNIFFESFRKHSKLKLPKSELYHMSNVRSDQQKEIKQTWSISSKPEQQNQKITNNNNNNHRNHDKRNAPLLRGNEHALMMANSVNSETKIRLNDLSENAKQQQRQQRQHAEMGAKKKTTTYKVKGDSKDYHQNKGKEWYETSKKSMNNDYDEGSESVKASSSGDVDDDVDEGDVTAPVVEKAQAEEAPQENDYDKQRLKWINDKGYAKHGWKNVYHKEEYGESKKYHDVWRHKDWKDRYNEKIGR